jgi:hypothetical protein
MSIAPGLRPGREHSGEAADALDGTARADEASGERAPKTEGEIAR